MSLIALDHRRSIASAPVDVSHPEVSRVGGWNPAILPHMFFERILVSGGLTVERLSRRPTENRRRTSLERRITALESKPRGRETAPEEIAGDV